MDKIWIKNYPKNIKSQIDMSPNESIVSFFTQKAKNYSSHIAAECMGTSLTYKELDRLSTCFAQYCTIHLKLKKGDRIGIMSPNTLYYQVILIGAFKAGLIVVGINPLYTATELKNQVKDSGLKTIVALDFYAHIIQNVDIDLPFKNIILMSIGDGHKVIKGKLINFIARNIKKLVKPFQLENAIYLNKILSSKTTNNIESIEINGNDIALIQYTGGTTGKPKGVILKHSNILANIYQVSACMKPIMGQNDTWIAPLPLYHIFALTASLATLNFGGKNIFITNPRDLDSLISTIKKSNFSIIIGVNTLFCALVNDKRFRKINFSNLKVAWAGGMPVQEYVAEKWHSITKIPLHVAYGLSETSPGVSADFYNTPYFSHSVGFPLPNTDIEIRDINNGEVLPIGKSGEICVKGPQVTSGYWNNQEATESTIQNGWLKTGDIGIINTEGKLSIIDRIKDMVIVSGFNVYTVEVEEVIGLIPEVLDVAVIGLPSNKTGEQLKAHIILRPNREISKEEIIKHCRKHLTGYKVPKLITFNTSLPLTPVGKILKTKLRKLPENNNIR